MMKHCIGLLGVMAGLLGAGCDTINRTQYQLSGPVSADGARATVSAADRAQVKEALSVIATQLRFEDRTELSLIPNAIGLFVQPEAREPVRIAAWENNGLIIVEITHEPSSTGETEYYRKVQEIVFTELQNRFGARATIPMRKNQARGR